MFENQDLLNTAPCGFLVFSDEGIILHVNDTLLKMLSFEKDKLVGEKLEKVLSLANRIFYQTHLFPLLKLHGQADEIFLTLLDAAGKEMHVLMNAKRIQSGEKAGNHCILIPVQQRKKFEQELLLARKAAEEALKKNDILLQTQQRLEENKQELDRKVSRLIQLNGELRQFSKVISHDLQEPIRKISIFAELAIRNTSEQPDSSLVTSLHKIRLSCERISKMVSSLEQFLSLDSSFKKLDRIELDHVINKVKDSALKATGFTGELHLVKNKLPAIIACRSQIELLFFNLFENAIKFRKAGQLVTVELQSTIFQENSYKSLPDNYRYHDVVKIIFTDHGKGFNTQHSSNLFQLFQKLQTDATGIGLGLALCKKVVDNHFGEIAVDSKPGAGTSFTISLPLLT